jgi:hypothetical protein
MFGIKPGAGGRGLRTWLLLTLLAVLVLSPACGGSKGEGSGGTRESGVSGSVRFAGDSLRVADKAGQVADSLDLGDTPGLVYGYGTRLDTPYVFTLSADGKTLYLNGLVYDGPGEIPPPEIEVTQTARSRHELSMQAYEQSRRGRTYEERKAIYADVLRGSDLVQTVREFSQGVYVTWRTSPDCEEEVIIPREESGLDLVAFQESLISQFRKAIESRGMIAFGKNYHIHIPPSRVPETLAQVERIRAGVRRDQLDIVGTPLQNEQFLSDIYKECQDQP